LYSLWVIESIGVSCVGVHNNFLLSVYNFADSVALINMIRNDKDRERSASEEELKRQEEEVRSVVRYCQNEVDCRRVQLLAYFGETFHHKDCHKSCDNCLDSSEVIKQDMSAAALEAIYLVKSLTQDKAKTTQNYCLDVFRGANRKEIRERKHNNHPFYGAGSKIPRDMVDRLFCQLLVVDAFRLVSVQNNSGWHNNYLEVCLTIPS
jgi:superfamily II DNA helicase RecQ